MSVIQINNKVFTINGKPFQLNPWTPADAPLGVQAWYDPSDLSTITEDGGEVVGLASIKPDGLGFETVDPSYNPTSGRTINGLNALDFVANDALGRDADDFQLPISQSMAFAVLDVDSISPDQWTVAAGFGGASRLKLGMDGLGNYTYGHTQNAFIPSAKIVAAATGPVLQSGYRDGNNVYAGANGIYGTPLVEVYDTPPTLDYVLLGVQITGTNGFDGGFGEVIVCNYYDLTIRQKIEGYLAWKWGQQANLPTDHPYKVGAPLA